MALIEARTCSAHCVVIRVNERAVVTIRGIVNGMAVGISQAKVEGSHALAGGNLKSMVDGRRFILQLRNGGNAAIGSEIIGNHSAGCDTEVYRGAHHSRPGIRNWCAAGSNCVGGNAELVLGKTTAGYLGPAIGRC